MVTIFTTTDNVNTICHDNSKEPWLNMIMKLGEVFIDSPLDIPMDMEDPIFILDQADIKFHCNKAEYIKSIPENPDKVLEEPCGIFLLDIPEDSANSIQTRFGVICQSCSKMDHDVLTHKGTTVEVVEDEYGKNWDEVFKKFKSTPSNSAIIIDAHLFENDSFDEANGCYDEGRSYGRDNLLTILNNILPDNFEGVYHVAVLLTDIDEAKKERRSRTTLTNARIVSAINKAKSKKLSRPYEICIEVHFFSQHEGFHKIIHNRRILSNYFVLDAQYKLAAFDKSGKGRAGQTISIHPLFELIHIDPESDMKERRLRYDLDDIYGYVESKCKNNSGGFYRNGRFFDSFYNVQHRLMI